MTGLFLLTCVRKYLDPSSNNCGAFSLPYPSWKYINIGANHSPGQWGEFLHTPITADRFRLCSPLVWTKGMLTPSCQFIHTFPGRITEALHTVLRKWLFYEEFKYLVKQTCQEGRWVPSKKTRLFHISGLKGYSQLIKQSIY